MARHNPHRHERVLPSRCLSRCREHTAESRHVGNGPVGVHGNHDGFRTGTAGDRVRCPGQGRGRPRGSRFGNDVLRRNLRQELLHRVSERRAGEDQGPRGWRERRQPVERVAQHRLRREQGKKLLRSLRRAQRPESRAHPAREDDDPHGCGHGRITSPLAPAPVSSATRAYSRFGLNGFVMKSFAPRRIASS